MGRAPCCDMEGLKKGPWTPEEDEKLLDYIKRNGHGSWRSIPKRAGLLRCGKSCRLRWTNYLRPDIKRGKFSSEEEQTIIQLHGSMGNKWSSIAARLPGRTDNEIKNYWNTHLRKRLLRMGLDPVTHRPMMGFFNFGNMNHFLGGPAAHSYMTAWWRNAMLQQAITREYLRIIATSIIHGQQQGSINAAELLMRSQLQNPIAKPEFNTNSIMSQFWSRNSKSQLGFLLEQFQSQSQIMKDNQHLPLAFGPHGFNTDKASLIPDQKLNGSEACKGLVNGSNLNMLDPPSKSQNITSSLALDISLLWDEDDLTGVSKSKSESLPAIISSTSSPDMFNDADLVSNVASSMLETNTSITANTTTPTTNEAYDFPTNFLWDLSENSERNENIPDTQNCADDRDYWSNMLKFVTECTVNNSRGLLGIRK